MSDAFRLPQQPVIYEINVAVFLSNLSEKYGHAIKLGSVPDEEWSAIAALPVDAVWLMGVWERSPYSRRSSMANKDLRETLPDFSEKDNLGSAYSVHAYEVDAHFGGKDDLAKARAALRRHSVGLILDFVPNHIACDHDWVKRHPEYLVAGDERDLQRRPDDFYKTPHGIFAYGKDPEYPAWSDVLQLNAFSEELRSAAAKTLSSIAAQCDGIRCDMAMLLTNHVFSMAWGDHITAVPEGEYWTTVIDAMRSEHPNCVLIAEVYWKWERKLLALGFDYCYDKTIYDHLVDNASVQLFHDLHTSPDYQMHLLRFIENHDEPRAAKIFTRPRHYAAAFMLATLPGAVMYHQGQLEGYRIKLPVHLGRGPHEETNQDVSHFYRDLITTIAATELRTGAWQLSKGNNGLLRTTKLLAWTWVTESTHFMCIVNYGAHAAAGHFELPSRTPPHYSLVLGADSISSKGVVLRENWLSVELKPWGYTLVRFGDA